MPDDGGVSEQAKPKRGRESTGDMVRSLSLVLAIVAVVFFFARPPGSDEQALREVDPTGDVQLFAQTHPDVPVPRVTPAGWRATVAASDPDLLRVGWVTPAGTYVEYAASSADPSAFVQEITGEAPSAGPVAVGAVTWQSYREGESTSLVLPVGGTTVVVGTVRTDASLADLRLLAGSLTR